MGRRAGTFLGREGFALFFALLILAALSACLGPLFSAGHFALLRSRRFFFTAVARQNARFALQSALEDLKVRTGDCRCVTTTASILGSDLPSACDQWTGVWRADRDGRRQFSKWLVSGTGADVDSLPRVVPTHSVPILADRGQSTRCPTVEIQSSSPIQGCYGYWVGDESVKVRINLPEPEIFCPFLVQRLGRTAPELADRIATVRGFHQLDRPFGVDTFRFLTLASAATLIGSDGGQPLEDLTMKLDRSQVGQFEYLFEPDPALPQPPPTFALIASYFRDVAPRSGDSQLLPRAIAPAHRLRWPMSYGDSSTLKTLETEAAIPTRYGLFPVILGFRFAFSVDRSACRLLFRPTVLLWNPNHIALTQQAYHFSLHAADGETRNMEDGHLALPAIELEGKGAPRRIPIGDDDGLIFSGEIVAGFAPGEVKTFQLASDDGWTFGRRDYPMVEGSSPGVALFLDLPRSLHHIRRLNSPALHYHWANLSCDLQDASGQLVQEILDFSDDRRSVDYWLDRSPPMGPPSGPSAGEHFLFAISGALKTAPGSDRNVRWLATYNPRAQQVRRSFYENRPIFGEREELFDRGLSNFRVEFLEEDRPIGPAFFRRNGPTSAAIFDCPTRLTSIGVLQHLNLTPFSYHPAQAVGNSWANPLIPINRIRHLRWPHFSPNSSNSALRWEALLDYSFLLNGRLFDNFFVSGFQWDPKGRRWRTFTNCHAVSAADPELLADCRSIAAHLLNFGAFNVNSPSVEAWEILLKSAPYDARSATYHFPRAVSSPGPSGRRLSDREIRSLAEAIVEEVRRHGPFLALSRFINRDPTATDEANLMGPLQRAINRAGLNDGHGGDRLAEDRGKDWFYEPAGAGGFNDGGPGYLTSADLLQLFGNFFTARGDTFLIRGYGDCHLGRSGRVLASAIGEMMVQRMADRSFKVIYFRWVK